jgi:hypothetical protein
MVSPLEVLEVLIHHDALSLLSNSTLTAFAATSQHFRTESGPYFRSRWINYLSRNVGFTDSEPEDDTRVSDNVFVVRARRSR